MIVSEIFNRTVFSRFMDIFVTCFNIVLVIIDYEAKEMILDVIGQKRNKQEKVPWRTLLFQCTLFLTAPRCDGKDDLDS